MNTQDIPELLDYIENYFRMLLTLKHRKITQIELDYENKEEIPEAQYARLFISFEKVTEENSQLLFSEYYSVMLTIKAHLESMGLSTITGDIQVPEDGKAACEVLEIRLRKMPLIKNFRKWRTVLHAYHNG